MLKYSTLKWFADFRTARFFIGSASDVLTVNSSRVGSLSQHDSSKHFPCYFTRLLSYVKAHIVASIVRGWGCWGSTGKQAFRTLCHPAGFHPGSPCWTQCSSSSNRTALKMDKKALDALWVSARGAFISKFPQTEPTDAIFGSGELREKVTLRRESK